ncbi:wall-associated receptor kinase-like 8 [Spinacia oleracea]|uniref:Wall-associated receptor kinase-like 8 n=1 Tax=Spinacia oleracea TaxID=3562 RepID=A0ABM3RS63_SPIOL|nr:wall-associated receptor kinase-like 8 [Spinacia oleracea]
MSLSILWLLLFLLPVSVEAIADPTSSTAIPPKTMLTAAVITKHSNCARTCGSLTIPYPFGVGRQCAHDDWFTITCDKTTYDSPKAFLWGPLDLEDREILEITETEVVIRNSQIASRCYDFRGKKVSENEGKFNISGSPFTLSHTANNLTVIGYNDYALIGDSGGTSPYEAPLYYRAGCITMCANLTVMKPGSCSGLGCCQTSVPIGLQDFTIDLYTVENRQRQKEYVPAEYCSYAFFAKVGNFSFGGASDLTTNGTVEKRTKQEVPVVLDWAFERYTSCKEAKKKNICQSNAECIDSEAGGYRCKCRSGYEGQPYLEPGCTDIDECASRPCAKYCKNVAGSFNCSCPSGYSGDGFKSGRGCYPDGLLKIITNLASGLGISLGIISMLLVSWWLSYIIEKRRIVEQKAKYFEQNSRLLLQQMATDESAMATIKIFTIDELERVTDNFNEDRILGKGGQGTVYKGMLSEGRIVAIKKSEVVNESQLRDFVNEVVILSQINHRNIVKLLGCCLEAEVPLLVYEYILNGTLFQHIHHPTEDFPITWKMRLQIASDSAGALAYLHTSSSIPIFHRDIKSSNILLDDKYRAKLSDFGTSKLVAIDLTHVTTHVHGTFGYLDPVYFQSSQFTEKSDVYSFGVVLIELLTGQKAIRSMIQEDRSLVLWFLSHLENSNLLDIVDSQILQEGSKEEFLAIANLGKRCLNLDEKTRPSMKEVLVEIERVMSLHFPGKNQKNWTEQVITGTSRTTNYSYDGLLSSKTFYPENISLSSAETSLLSNPK